jgi:hypothetical protein
MPQGLSPDEQSRWAALIEREGSAAIVVAKSDEDDLHPLARKVRRILLADKPDADWGCVRCSEATLPYVRVSPSGVTRAAFLLDAICRSFDARGWRWRAGSDQPWRTASVEVEGEPFLIQLEETSRRVRHILSPEERGRMAKRTSWEAILRHPIDDIPSWDFRPSNEFSVRDLSSTNLVRDTPSALIEAKLSKLPSRMIEIAFARKAAKRIQAKREAYLAEQAGKREHLNRLRELAAAAGERLTRQAAQWRRANKLREFVAAAELAPVSAELTEQKARWIAWATARADEIDPLRSFGPIVAREAEIMDDLTSFECGQSDASS